MSIRESQAYKTMTPFDACACVEQFGGYEEPTQEELNAAWQYILDTGLWRQLQGFYGRTVFDLLDNGMLESPLTDN